MKKSLKIFHVENCKEVLSHWEKAQAIKQEENKKTKGGDINAMVWKNQKKEKKGKPSE